MPVGDRQLELSWTESNVDDMTGSWSNLPALYCNWAHVLRAHALTLQLIPRYILRLFSLAAVHVRCAVRCDAKIHWVWIMLQTLFDHMNIQFTWTDVHHIAARHLSVSEVLHFRCHFWQRLCYINMCKVCKISCQVCSITQKIFRLEWQWLSVVVVTGVQVEQCCG